MILITKNCTHFHLGLYPLLYPLYIPKDTISEALGHVHGSKITGVYIKFSRDKIDAANRRVIDWVVNGK